MFPFRAVVLILSKKVDFLEFFADLNKNRPRFLARVYTKLQKVHFLKNVRTILQKERLTLGN